ncbi:MAG TPA: glutathione S-transferase [Cellvibrio sp.]|nr:glutathione S-transferase [Cellvibrio sp.]
MIELFEFGLSGNCHKVRIMLSLLGLEYRSRAVNGGEREHKSAEFLAMNPFGQVPVLKDGDTLIRDSQAILVYLARKYGGDKWFPQDPATAAEIVAWLSTAANEVARGPNALRLHYKFGREINVKDAEIVTENLLALLNQHLVHHTWLATDTITIADVALYPYIALAHEGKVDLTPYPQVENWLGRLELLRGYVAMPGIQLRNI